MSFFLPACTGVIVLVEAAVDGRAGAFAFDAFAAFDPRARADGLENVPEDAAAAAAASSLAAATWSSEALLMEAKSFCSVI